MEKVAQILSFYNIKGKAAYDSRASGGKHRGQRKLNVMELFFLKRYGQPGDNVLYVGAAPGTHLVELAPMFPEMNFVLFDPLPFDPRLCSIPNVKVNQCFFTSETCSDFLAEPEKCLFVCDIRSSGYETGTASEDNDVIIVQDMTMQWEWTKMLGARRSMLKFKPLYPGSEGGDTFEYPDGELFMQPFAKRGSTEMRLVVHDSQSKVAYDKRLISERCAFFNQQVRTDRMEEVVEAFCISAR